jgi:hypothetical protein
LTHVLIKFSELGAIIQLFLSFVSGYDATMPLEAIMEDGALCRKTGI